MFSYSDINNRDRWEIFSEHQSKFADFLEAAQTDSTIPEMRHFTSCVSLNAKNIQKMIKDQSIWDNQKLLADYIAEYNNAIDQFLKNLTGLDQNSEPLFRVQVVFIKSSLVISRITSTANKILFKDWKPHAFITCELDWLVDLWIGSNPTQLPTEEQKAVLLKLYQKLTLTNPQTEEASLRKLIGILATNSTWQTQDLDNLLKHIPAESKLSIESFGMLFRLFVIQSSAKGIVSHKDPRILSRLPNDKLEAVLSRILQLRKSDDLNENRWYLLNTVTFYPFGHPDLFMGILDIFYIDDNASNGLQDDKHISNLIQANIRKLPLDWEKYLVLFSSHAALHQKFMQAYHSGTSSEPISKVMNQLKYNALKATQLLSPQIHKHLFDSSDSLKTPSQFLVLFSLFAAPFKQTFTAKNIQEFITAIPEQVSDVNKFIKFVSEKLQVLDNFSYLIKWMKEIKTIVDNLGDDSFLYGMLSIDLNANFSFVLSKIAAGNLSPAEKKACVLFLHFLYSGQKDHQNLFSYYLSTVNYDIDPTYYPVIRYFLARSDIQSLPKDAFKIFTQVTDLVRRGESHTVHTHTFFEMIPQKSRFAFFSKTLPLFQGSNLEPSQNVLIFKTLACLPDTMHTPEMFQKYASLPLVEDLKKDRQIKEKVDEHLLSLYEENRGDLHFLESMSRHIHENFAPEVDLQANEIAARLMSYGVVKNNASIILGPLQSAWWAKKIVSEEILVPGDAITSKFSEDIPLIVNLDHLRRKADEKQLSEIDQQVFSLFQNAMKKIYSSEDYLKAYYTINKGNPSLIELFEVREQNQLGLEKKEFIADLHKERTSRRLLETNQRETVVDFFNRCNPQFITNEIQMGINAQQKFDQCLPIMREFLGKDQAAAQLFPPKSLCEFSANYSFEITQQGTAALLLALDYFKIDRRRPREEEGTGEGSSKQPRIDTE